MKKLFILPFLMMLLIACNKSSSNNNGSSSQAVSLNNTAWVGYYQCPTWAPSSWPANYVKGYTTAANTLPITMKIVNNSTNAGEIWAYVTFPANGDIVDTFLGNCNTANTTIAWNASWSYDRNLEEYYVPSTSSWAINGNQMTGTFSISSGCQNISFVLYKQ